MQLRSRKIKKQKKQQGQRSLSFQKSKKNKKSQEDKNINAQKQQQKLVVPTIQPQPKKQKILKKVKYNQFQLDRIHRSKNQRMFLLSVQKISNSSWRFQVLGASGKTYSVNVSSYLTCGCVDYHMKKQPCKHIYFIVTQVARDDQLLRNFKNIKLSQISFKILDKKLTERLTSRMKPKQEKKKIQANEKQINLGDDKDCAICFESLQDDLTSLQDCKQCKKFFHDQCIKVWSQKNSTCPLCRYQLKFDQKKQEQNENQIKIDDLKDDDPLRKLKKIKL